MPHSARSHQELIALAKHTRKLSMVLFWGHTPNSDGSLSKSCLSQFYPAEFIVEGVRYRSAEQFMMASKARLFGDTSALEQILAAPTPQQAKALGRMVAGFVESTWVDRRFDAVVTGNLAKFGQNAELRKFLLATRDSILVEASPTDRIWGIGLAADDPRAQDPSRWRGENLLGFALMEVRARLSD